MGPIETYIRARAPLYGIDPDIAVRVAKSEGGLTDPFRQSDVWSKEAGRERSYGPFQLYIDGGLGNRALAAGIDPRKNWQGGVDFALAEAGKKGWGQWYGAAKAGIGDFDGIKGYTGTGPTGAGTTLTSNPYGNGTNVFGPGQTGLPAGEPAPAPPAGKPGILDFLKGGNLGGIAKALGGGGQQEMQFAEVSPSRIEANSGNEGAAKLLASLLSNSRKRHGLSLSTEF
jgi:hypothetical protein